MPGFPPLRYSRPGTLRQALAAVRREGACIYAGGTDLLVALHHRESATAWIRELVDIKDLREARGISVLGSDLRLGALVTAEELIRSPVVRRVAPLLRDAAQATSAPMLRARGTIGGNVVTPHPSGDLATAFLALGARVEVAGPRGGRATITILQAMTRRPAGIILALRVPVGVSGAWEKVAHRRTFARAIAAVALARHAQSVHVAIGGIDTRPVMVRAPRSAPGDAGAVAAFVEREMVAIQRLDEGHRRVVLALVRRAARRLP